MKILVISGAPWRDDLNVGNTYSNLFGNMENTEIANIFLKSGSPSNNVVKKYYQITEKTLLTNLFNAKNPSGRELIVDGKADCFTEKEEVVYDKLRIKRWMVFFWGRELIWKLGRWKSSELKAFLDDFKPDIIFAQLKNNIYLNDIILFVKKYTKKPLILYAWDDVYTLKRFSFSPLYWADRIMQRPKIRSVVSECEFLYVISPLQKKEYEKIFNKECRLLFKGYDFGVKPEGKSIDYPLKLVYTGNIYGGRWKTLVKIGRALEKINKEKIKAQLYIYSNTPMTKKMTELLNIDNTVFLMGGVEAELVAGIQADADILVHVETTDLLERFSGRHSLSTKLVDYFYAARCIFAVGIKNLASIDYLIKKDAAIVATDELSIYNKLMMLINEPSIIEEYAQKAWLCGKKNHQLNDIQKRLYNDLKNIK